MRTQPSCSATPCRRSASRSSRMAVTSMRLIGQTGLSYSGASRAGPRGSLKLDKIWANSADSHLVEPEDIFRTSLPPALADRMPRSEKDPGGEFETVFVDGKQFRRRMPRTSLVDERGRAQAQRAPGANDMELRLRDLDGEGIWCELVYPSLGIW